VFQDGWLRPLPSFDAEFADISQLRHLKARVNQALELKREDGTLGSASEALVLVRVPSGSECLSPIARQGLLLSLFVSFHLSSALADEWMCVNVTRSRATEQLLSCLEVLRGGEETGRRGPGRDLCFQDWPWQVPALLELGCNRGNRRRCVPSLCGCIVNSVEEHKKQK